MFDKFILTNEHPFVHFWPICGCFFGGVGHPLGGGTPPPTPCPGVGIIHTNMPPASTAIPYTSFYRGSAALVAHIFRIPIQDCCIPDPMSLTGVSWNVCFKHPGKHLITFKIWLPRQNHYAHENRAEILC